jgi:hypothetical protein
MATANRTTQLDTLEEHACAVSDLAAQMRRYLDESTIADTYPAQVLLLRLMLDECKKRAGLLIELIDD